MALTKEEIREMTLLALTTPQRRRSSACLTFHQEGKEFTIRCQNRHIGADVALYWSTDKKVWARWGYTDVLTSVNGYLYFRGEGNTALNPPVSVARATFAIDGEEVYCSGNIETLLDWQSVQEGRHPAMDGGAFGGLFQDNTCLVSAPKLPAVTLTQGCYGEMFKNCTGLKRPPALPATELAVSCYSQMFWGCTSLECLPELTAINLPRSAYSYMFYGCTGISLSETEDSTYKYPFRIPSNGNGTIEGAALYEMFTRTGGPFTGTPTINTTYYTDHKPV